MRARHFIFSAAVVAALFCPLTSEAAILTFVMEGTVTGQYSDPPGLSPIAQIGDPVRFAFTFDSEAPDGATLPWLGSYLGISASLRLGETDYTCLTPGITVQHPPDVFEVKVQLEPPQGTDVLRASAYFSLLDQYENDALQSTVLPLSPYPLGLFESTSFAVNLVGPPSPPWTYDAWRQVYGMIDAFYAIPEPFTFSLLAVGIVVYGHRGCSRP